MIILKDNFLEKELINFLYNHFKLLPHYYGHSSNDVYYEKKNQLTENLFYASNLNLNEPLYTYLCTKVASFFKQDIEIIRCYINVQYCNMDGAFHEDDGDQTIVLMVSPTLNKKSGCFEIFEIKKNKEKLRSIDFIQNRLIIFPATWKHKGCAPIEKNLPRITLAFKTKIHENKNIETNIR